MNFNIADLFEAAADAVPGRTAVVAGARRLTYEALEERANRVANHLADRGVGKDDHVAIYAYNCAEWVEAMLGIAKVRAVPINVNYRYVGEELRYVLDDADTSALFFHRRLSSPVAAVAPSLPLLRHLVVIDDGSGEPCDIAGVVEYERELAESSAARAFPARSADDRYILYTGGTTGMPKGVMWRHEDVICVLGGGIRHDGKKREHPEEFSEQARSGSHLVQLPLAPLMHGAGQWATLSGLFVGATIVLSTDESFDADAAWRLIEREKVNAVFFVGDAIGRPLAEALATNTYDLSSLRAMTSTAAVFSPSVKELLLRHLPGEVVLTESIGASETGFNGVAIVTDADPRGRGPRVAPGPGTVVLDDTGKPVRPGSGVVGVLARSGNVPIGYYNDDTKSAATFIVHDGTRYSIPGDHATVEEDGSIVLLGRGSGCINSGGEKIFPEEVEKAVKSHPEVMDVVVVGVPDERWGQRVAAIVQPRPGRTPDLQQIATHCRSVIAGYKVPRELHLVDAVMRQPSGKPDYRWARAIAADRGSRSAHSPSSSDAGAP